MGEPVLREDANLGAWLEERLYEFNRVASGHDDGRELAFAVEAEGEVVAGVAGYTWGGMADVKQLWVREDLRRRGVGAALMGRAIAEARARGCEVLYLTTHSFQAPGFYLRLGFEEVAVLRGKPAGHAEHVMRLKLT